MTAIMSCVKTKFRLLGVDEEAVRGDCSSERDNRLISAPVFADMAEMSTDIVSTAPITHATPAATYANSVDRGWEDIFLILSDDIMDGCQDIVLQAVNFGVNRKERCIGVRANGGDVIKGGGRQHFFPSTRRPNTSGVADKHTSEDISPKAGSEL